MTWINGIISLLVKAGIFALLLAGSAFSVSAGSESDRGIFAGGEKRDYRLYIPDTLKPAGERSLVIMLHGGGGNGRQASEAYGWNEKADEEGFIVAYPSGSGKLRKKLLTWNAGHCCAYAMREETDDVGFIKGLIANLVYNYKIDPNRVYVTGLSNGGMMTHRLGRELSDSIAAIAPVVGAVFADDPKAKGPVSTLIMTGMLDKNVPPGGGYGDHVGRKQPNDKPYATANDQLIYWVRQNGCKAPTTIDASHIVQKIVYSGCKNDTAVVHYYLYQIGHAWPGSKVVRKGADDSGTEFDATSVIWDFFKVHPKKPATAE